MQRCETSTDRLTDVLQVLRLGRKTGVLTVERGAGLTFEEGTLTLVDGQVTQAQLGFYTDKDALDRLLSWENCYFAFLLTPSPPLLFSRSVRPKNNRHTDTLPYLAVPSRTQTDPNLRKVESFTPHARIPYRIDRGRDSLQRIESMGLSRFHRHLFQLIDGQRNMVELMRLTGHSPQEIEEHLHDLERAHFIRR